MTEKENNQDKPMGLGRIELTIIKPAEKLKTYAVNKSEADFYLSCLTGGTTAANVAVDHVCAVQKIWGEGSDYKAVALAKMFSLVMLSQWFYQLRKNSNLEGQKEKAYRASAWMLLSLFEQEPQKPHWPALLDVEVDIAAKLDEQFRYEIEKDDDMAAYAILLLAWAVQSAGEVVLDWNKVEIPLKDFSQLTKAQAILKDEPFQTAQNLLDILTAQQSGVAAMARFYQQMRPITKEKPQDTTQKPAAKKAAHKTNTKPDAQIERKDGK